MVDATVLGVRGPLLMGAGAAWVAGFLSMPSSTTYRTCHRDGTSAGGTGKRGGIFACKA